MNDCSTPPDWTLSIVSHGHSLEALIRGLATALRSPERFELVITHNLPPSGADLACLWPGPISIISNDSPKGFSANHNAALRRGQGRYLAAIDPDLVMLGDPFDQLAQVLDEPASGIVSTHVLDESGQWADHARPAPSPWRLLKRHLPGARDGYESAPDRILRTDWVAGLFMAMRADTFARLNGFDDRYFMYCEDVDLCLRAWNMELSVQVVPAAAVVHPARRQSLKRLRHFLWHCASLIRLWTSVSYYRFLNSERGKHSRKG